MRMMMISIEVLLIINQKKPTLNKNAYIINTKATNHRKLIGREEKRRGENERKEKEKKGKENQSIRRYSQNTDEQHV